MCIILIPWLASPLCILGKSRMRKRARTDCAGGDGGAPHTPW